ncbi:MAG: TRAP transporter small permease [Pararhodobacter sp.]|nr:TRAP transporter small permease [Pararhodobacter sp.]
MTDAGNLFTRANLLVAVTAVGAIIALTLLELIARMLGRPLSWGADISAYALCIALCAAMPHVTRQGAQIAVTLIREVASPSAARRLKIMVELMSGAAGFTISALCIHVAFRQYGTGVSTIAIVTMPKWIISSLLAYGFASSGLMHLLNAYGSFREGRRASASGGHR